ncbi:DUF2254 domain-containing protein [Bowmanella sp. Y26]|uniref:DUF2254 domain-containing protein n=1 Tax=Bowmanella yangjiangensis TaxID=2811230 RepID=UPI001BDD8E95|nr:DUF2254 domain-containing protein [Bowmanella yangjiangensis]MBT1064458.1 DUF2254 domain-containing protein [Bowmanella yangjiangensis]
MVSRMTFWANKLSERLWVRPLLMCLVSVVAAFMAQWLGNSGLSVYLPSISRDSLETLLSIMSSSMLVIATFCVGSMVAAYASAGNSATPRSFALVIADDVSQNALATFIGAFIFSVVAIVAVKNDFYAEGGHFVLFCMTLSVLAAVIVTFVRWVDRIARLGRVNSTIDKIEEATAKALEHRKQAPLMGGIALTPVPAPNMEVHILKPGYIQRIELTSIQKLAEQLDMTVRLLVLPGSFVFPGQPVLLVGGQRALEEQDISTLQSAFILGKNRTFIEDPRFGLVVLSQVACKALSPAVNDAGTAIDVLSSFARLFSQWNEPVATEDMADCRFDRIQVPELDMQDLFDDAFNAIGRDGAGSIEVVLKLQKTLTALADCPAPGMREAARLHAARALARAEQSLSLDTDKQQARQASCCAASASSE